MRRGAFLAVCAVVLLAAPRAHAQKPLLPLPEIGSIAPLAAEVQHLHYAYGPVHVPVGGNLILLGPVTIEKPAYDGYVTRFAPNLVRADGSVPPVDVIHLHHGVWLNASGTDATAGGGERMAAAGEEKTVVQFPPGYGYPVKGSDFWIMNHMIHNQTAVPENVWITYDVDFVPAKSALGQRMKPARPVWMDVQNGSFYPVFNVKKGSGRKGRYTYPKDASKPYGGGAKRNEWVVDRPGVLVATAGHLHPGGLYTDLNVRRAGERAHLFRSVAKYFEPAGAVSWDVAMTGTRADWRVKVRKGDVLSTSATYDTKRGAWWESMGIMVTYMADSGPGRNPFKRRVDFKGTVTHGHLAENNNHGGSKLSGLPDPTSMLSGPPTKNVNIRDYVYGRGDLALTGKRGRPPIVKRGKSIKFTNLDSLPGQSLRTAAYHTITACKAPCNRTTGIAYPIANAKLQFDSAQLGYGPSGFTAAANRNVWRTPKNLPRATYTYFCRVHPFMRGSFRVK
jgi:hypothetical protein